MKGPPGPGSQVPLQDGLMRSALLSPEDTHPNSPPGGGWVPRRVSLVPQAPAQPLTGQNLLSDLEFACFSFLLW